MNQIFSLATPFITSCPTSNPKLPVAAFPALTTTGTVAAGQSIKLVYKNSGQGDRWLALLSGLTMHFSKIASDNTATLPAGLQGTVYAVVTNSGTAATDATTVAGPDILMFPFASQASN